MIILDSGVNTMNEEKKEMVGNKEVLTTETDGKTIKVNNSSDNIGEVDGTSLKKALTESEVNDLIQERLKRKEKSILEKLGCETFEECEKNIAKGKKFDEVNSRKNELETLLLFQENNISKEKTDDVRYYFKGKGIDFTEENLKKELETHQEWLESPNKKEDKKENNGSNVFKVGGEGSNNDNDDRKEFLSKYFGL